MPSVQNTFDAWRDDGTRERRPIPAIDPRWSLVYHAGMTSDPDMHDLAQQIIRLDGKINTSRAENDAMESRIDARLAGMEANMANWKTDMANWKTDMAQRDKDNLRWTVGFGIAQMLVTVAILGSGLAFLGILLGS